MSPFRTGWSITAAVLLSLAMALSMAPAQAATSVMPGSFTGYAFDTCHAPTQEQMDVWLERSPYWGIGIYIAGDNRYCSDQPLLTPDWIAQQSRKGWRVLPLTVGPQARCSGRDYDLTISQTPTADYAEARAQGRTEARTTVRAATALGIAKHSTLWYDLEHYAISNDSCRQSALAFLSAWTRRLHALDYQSGVYSSASSGIAALDYAAAVSPGSYVMPDQIWWAGWSAAAWGGINPAWVRSDSWMPHSRVHQYLGGHNETHGGVTINIDSDFMDVGLGSVAPKAAPHCGVQIDFGSYPLMNPGRRGSQVAAAQCLLRQKHFYSGDLNGRFNRATYHAVRGFQRTHALPVTGSVSRRTWTAMLSEGPTPLMKYGSASHGVRRLQRALNAASAENLEVTGVFEGTTTAALKRYQRAHALPGSGVVTDDIWDLLHRGKL